MDAKPDDGHMFRDANGTDGRAMHDDPTGIYERGCEAMTLGEFRSKLEQFKVSPNWRLFVCDGSPFACRLFILGVNPARDTEKPFWDTYWSNRSGFNKSKLIRDLEQLPGGLTKTRKRIELIAGAVRPKITLDTNIYLPPTKSEAQLSKKDKEINKIVEWLLHQIRPEVVLVHGAEPFRYFRKHCPSLIDQKLVPQKVIWNDLSLQVLYSTQLGWIGDEEAKNICQTLVQVLRPK